MYVRDWKSKTTEFLRLPIINQLTYYCLTTIKIKTTYLYSFFIVTERR